MATVFLPSTSLTTLNTLTDKYIFSATNGTDYTYNLPEIKCNGMSLQFVRNDRIASAIVTISRSSTDQILFNGQIVTNVNILPEYEYIFLSSGTIWSVVSNSKRFTSQSGSLFSIGYDSNENQSWFQQITANGDYYLASFTYIGRSVSLITSISHLFKATTYGSDSANLRLALKNLSGTVIGLGNIVFVSNPAFPNTYPLLMTLTNVNHSLLSDNPQILQIYLRVSSLTGNFPFDSYSFIVL
jgi:hypothetical protein